MDDVMKNTIPILLIFFLTNAAAAEFNELRIGTRLNLDPNIKTVKQAVEWILRPTRYKVTVKYPAPMESLEISRSPISPLVQNDISRVPPIEEAILLVIGGDNRLVVDHEHRLISFEKIPRFAVAGEEVQ
jgi:hypothetical protein